MLKLISLVLVGCCFQFLFIQAGNEEERKLALMLKVFASICFITLGVIAYRDNTNPFTLTVLIGLILGGVGDLFMELRWLSKKVEALAFISGTIAFLLGHVVYIVALLSVCINKTLPIVTGIVIGIILVTILFRIITADNRLKVLGFIYILTISIMFASAAFTNIVFAVGALLFVSSDFSLIMYNFSSKYHTKQLREFYLAAYYAAQLLIAFSIML